MKNFYFFNNKKCFLFYQRDFPLFGKRLEAAYPKQSGSTKQCLLFILFLLVTTLPMKAQLIDFDTLQTSTVTDVEGNVYKTILFGDTWWMAENLKTKHYNDGTSILQMTKLIDDSDDTNSWDYWTMVDRWAYPGLDSTNYDTYGLLYSYTAGTNTSHNGICPEGWTLADTTAWLTLGREIVGDENVVYDTGTRNTPDDGKETYYEATEIKTVGRYLKSDNGTLWTLEPTISRTCNQSGMNVKPSGKIYTTVNGMGELADFWTPNYVHSNGSGQGRRYIHFDYSTHSITVAMNHNANMQCVRCIKEAEAAAIKQIEESQSQLYIWPNPATSYLMAWSPTETNFKIIAIDGKVCLTGKLSEGENEIILSSFSKGLYFLIGGKQTQKFIIQ